MRLSGVRPIVLRPISCLAIFVFSMQWRALQRRMESLLRFDTKAPLVLEFFPRLGYTGAVCRTKKNKLRCPRSSPPRG